MAGTGGSPNGDVATPRLVEVTAIGHDGKVVVVGITPDGDLCYTVRQSGFEDSALDPASDKAMPGFESWKPVPLSLAVDDPSVRGFEEANLVTADGGIIMRSRYGSDGERSAVGRIKLVSGLGHLYLFRVSVDGRLLLNRFVLDGMTNDLVPKFEVRFRRSGQKLVPEGGPERAGGGPRLDSLGFRDLDQNLFYEPTQELTFLGRFEEGRPWFSVELVPTAEHDRFRWQFFVLTDGELRLVSVAASEEGLINLRDQAKLQPDPRSADKKIVRTIPGIVDRTLRLPGRVAAGFDTTLYHNQVERMTKAGPQLLKDSTRVMLSVPVTRPGGSDTAVAAVSFAVSNLGELAQIDRTANQDQVLVGDVKEVLLPLADLEDIQLVADRTPPPLGGIARLEEGPSYRLAVVSDVPLQQRVRAGQKVRLSGTRTYDGTYVAHNVDGGAFEVDVPFNGAPDDLTQGSWEMIESGDGGLVFENMIASYERTGDGRLRIRCESHNLVEGDEIRITGSTDHDGVHPVTDVADDSSFEIDLAWPAGQVVNLSRRPRRGLSFDGQGDYLTVPDVELPVQHPQARLERTVSAWIRLDGGADTAQTVFTTESEQLHLLVDPEGRAALEVRFADGHRAVAYDPDPLPVDTWVHVAGQLDYRGEEDGGTVLTLCRNGRPVATSSVDARKPIHLALRNLQVDGQALPIKTHQYDVALPEAITVEAWVNTSQDGEGTILSWYCNGRYDLAVRGDGDHRVVVWRTGDQEPLVGSSHLGNDHWHHVAVTYDPSSRVRTIVIDGTLDTEDEAPSPVGDETRSAAAEARVAASASRQPLWLGMLGAAVGGTTADGRDAYLVRSDGGGFRQVGQRQWRSTGAGGEPTGDPMTEVARDDGSITLRDENDTHRIILDLARGQVLREDRDVRTRIDDIVSSVAVNGLNANRVDDPDGSWQQLDDRTWERFDDSGQPTGEQRTESRRDQWSVYFTIDGSTHQLDLWRKKVCLWERGNRTDVTDITGSSAPASAGEVALNGRNVRRVHLPATRIEQAPDGRTWRLLGGDGDRTFDGLVEVNRSEWSVFLRNPAEGYRLELDLWNKAVFRIDDRRRTVQHTVTGYDGPALVGAAEHRFRGFLADVRVWNRSRAASTLRRAARNRLNGTERNLVAFWPLQETSASELSDLARSKAHIDASAAEPRLSWYVRPHRAPGSSRHYEGDTCTDSYALAATAGRVTQVLNLREPGDHVAIPELADDLRNGFTVMAWARWDRFNPWSRILDFGREGGEDYIVIHNREETGTLLFSVRHGTATRRLQVPDALVVGEWVHVAATVAPDGAGVLYVNGEARARGQLGRPLTTVRTRNYLGRSSTATDTPFQGAVRDVQFWGRSLDGDEVVDRRDRPVEGTEPGLLHHWSMRTSSVDGHRLVLDEGTGSARPGELVGRATVGPLDADLPPAAGNELRGQLSDVQLWTVNRPVETIRATMYDRLTGNEHGLAGSWRCGGILRDPTPGSSRRLTPDFAVDGHDAVVVGDTYVSARALPRRSSAGRAVRYRNEDLVAVTQGARYRESFEFRALDGGGDPWRSGDLADADGRGNPLFRFRYWGQRARTSTERVEFQADEEYDFTELGDGWFRARCDITVPDGVSMIRAFEIDDVRGRWSRQDEPPDDEWAELEVRKHRLEMISNSISRRSYVDQLDLATLVADASELEDALRRIPVLERRAASLRVDLDEVLEALLIFASREKYEAEQESLRSSTAELREEVTALDAEIGAFPADPVNYRHLFRAKESGRVLDCANGRTAIQYHAHGGTNQAWEFRRTAEHGQYRVACVQTGTFLVSDDIGSPLRLATGDGPNHRWSLEDLGKGYRTLRNVATNGRLDVFGGGLDDEVPIISWPATGRNNQAWRMEGWIPEWHDLTVAEHEAGFLRGRTHRATPAWRDQLRGQARRADRIRSKYPAGAQKKSTYDTELDVLRSRRDRAAGRLATDRARLDWLSAALANRTPEQERALLTRRDELEEELRRLQDEINGTNTDYVESARLVRGEAQTMALVAEDVLGLRTYGSVLGFASPIGGVTSAATAEGNVQLSYFDQHGRFRFTNYDATSDSTNAAYEQWLPATTAVCPELARRDALVRLAADSPVELDRAGHTTEAWFYYPPPFQPDGRPYPVNFLTSDASGEEATIAIAASSRLGTVVDGFFHDAGVDLATTLDAGWHHVAARCEGSSVAFHLDGDRVGHHAGSPADAERYAMSFDGNGSFLRVGDLPAASHDFGAGVTIQTWVRWDARGRHARILDLGNGLNTDTIALSGGSDPRNIYIQVGAERVAAKRVVTLGRWMNVAATVGGGVAVIYVDGAEVARGELPTPDRVDRRECFIGRTGGNPSGHTDLDGALSQLHLWNRVLSRAEIRRHMFQPPTAAPGLLHSWSMAVEENGEGALRAVDGVDSFPTTARLAGAATSLLLDKVPGQPVVALGNRAGGGAPAGRVAEYRFWSTALRDEEIRINGLTHLTGNEPDLVAHFPLDDVLDDGAPARDRTGRHRPAAVEAGTTVARTANIGSPGAPVLNLAGARTRINLPDLSLAGRSFTVEFWLKRPAGGRADWYVDQGTDGTHQRLHIGFRGNGVYSFAFYGDDVNVRLPDLGLNQWVHLAHVYDHDAGVQQLFIDGVRRSRRKVSGALEASGPLVIGGRGADDARGQLAELRIWDHARDQAQIAAGRSRRMTGAEAGLLSHLPLTTDPPVDTVAGRPAPDAVGARTVRTDDLPIRPGPNLVTAEYSTVGADPRLPDRQRAVLRRFFTYASDGGDVVLLPGKSVEELLLRWIGNAQFEPTLLGYIEGAPPVPSENLTVNYDYDGGSTVELVQSDEVMYSWNRNRDIGGGLDANFFLGAAWGLSGGVVIKSTISEGHLGIRGNVNAQWRRNENSTIRATSTDELRDRLDLRGSFETEPRFPQLGNRYVPKNVGYALVISGLADVFITQMRRSGRMVAYEVLPVEDVPPDVNIITFLINPAYVLNGSLDGLVGSQAADERMYRHVPEMRAQYGSRYPASYYDVRQAYDLKAQIERWDKDRESYFVNFDARETGLSDALLDQAPGQGDADKYGRVEVDRGTAGEDGDQPDSAALEEAATDQYQASSAGDRAATEKRRSEIERQFADRDKQLEANAAFASWQRRMEGLRIRAGKRNIVNTYVWDADGGVRSEEQHFANTVEHTIGGTFSLNASLGRDANVAVGGFKFELQALASFEMSQTMSKTASATRSFDLNIRLDGVEQKGVTDADDYPVLPGEKVDRYRFMSFYLEGDTNHFTDFFDHVVDPEWLLSNDEEARALRQVARGRANRTWRVLHRVTYVERPALLGFGQDLRAADDLEAATQEVFNYFDALERSSDALRADIGGVRAEVGGLARKVDDLAASVERRDLGAPPSTNGGVGPDPSEVIP